MVKYLFSDVDGTLIKKQKDSHSYVIDDSTKKQIINFVNNGNKFIMATGRMDHDIKFLEDQIGVKCDFRISQNGSVICDINDNPVYQSHFPDEFAIDIANYCDSLSSSLRWEVSTFSNRYSSSKRPSHFVADFVNPIIVVENIVGEIGKSIIPTIFLLMAYDNNDFHSVRNYINEKYGDHLQAVSTGIGFLEIMSKGSSKGKAIDFLFNHYHYDKSNVFAVGDSENDVSMFQCTKNSFAMKEANGKIINQANYVVDYVGDVIDYISSPQDNFLKTNKNLVRTKSQCCINLETMEHNNLYDNDFISKIAMATILGGSKAIICNKIVNIKAIQEMNNDVLIYSRLYDGELSSTHNTDWLMNRIKILIQLGVGGLIVNFQDYKKIALNELISLAKKLCPNIIIIMNLDSNYEVLEANKLNIDVICLNYKEQEYNNNLVNELVKSCKKPLFINYLLPHNNDVKKLLQNGVYSIILSDSVVNQQTIMQQIVSDL